MEGLGIPDQREVTEVISKEWDELYPTVFCCCHSHRTISSPRDKEDSRVMALHTRLGQHTFWLHGLSQLPKQRAAP